MLLIEIENDTLTFDYTFIGSSAIIGFWYASMMVLLKFNSKYRFSTLLNNMFPYFPIMYQPLRVIENDSNSYFVITYLIYFAGQIMV